MFNARGCLFSWLKIQRAQSHDPIRGIISKDTLTALNGSAVFTGKAFHLPDLDRSQVFLLGTTLERHVQMEDLPVASGLLGYILDLSGLV